MVETDQKLINLKSALLARHGYTLDALYSIRPFNTARSYEWIASARRADDGTKVFIFGMDELFVSIDRSLVPQTIDALQLLREERDE